jgi:CheY-like chemotaxis protein
MLGGSIQVKSQVGVGSTFTFSIPCNSFQENDNSEMAENDKSEKISGTKKLKILITEDDADIATIIEKTIQDLSFEILFAGTGEQAVDICERQPDIDLIIMDINLPGIDGISATQKIRTFNNNVVIIAQTAYTQKGDREKVLTAGCNDYISKPFRISDLHKLVEKYCVVGSIL